MSAQEMTVKFFYLFSYFGLTIYVTEKNYIYFNIYCVGTIQYD